MRGFVLAGGIWLAALLTLSGCGFPGDPRGTLERVRGGEMRVGMVENPPWTGGGPSGVEAELVDDFARELDAETVYVRGTTPELLEATKQGEVDILVGGFTDEAPGIREQKEAGITQPYLIVRPFVGVPPGSGGMDDLAEERVAVAKTGTTAAHLKEEGAFPVRTENLRESGLPVAAYRWQLEAWGFEPVGVELPEERHVMAVPPGENGWLVTLDRFLAGRRAEAEELLREETLG